MKTEYENYVDGKWVEASGGVWGDVYCPSDGTHATRFSKGNAADMEQAIAAARRAFDANDWSATPQKRFVALHAWAREIRADAEHVAQLLTLETGKPIGESRFEIDRAVNYLEFYASALRTLFGTNNSLDNDTMSILVREPVGVVGGIVPWNAPVVLLMRDISPALAAGCTAVIKPSSSTPCCILALMDALDRTGKFPSGVVNCLAGESRTAGETLLSHPDVDMISFTGSTEVGQHIMEVCSKTMKRVSLELGGKSANVIFADADLEKALIPTIKGFCTNAGQVCTSGTRLIIEESACAPFLAMLKAKLEAMTVGPGSDPKSDMGPVMSKKQMESILAMIDEAKKVSTLVTGGYRITAGACRDGYFIAPTVFLNPPMDSDIVQHETFGPVLTVNTFKTVDEAIALANGTRYGLASGVWSRDINKALRVARAMRAGTAWVNSYNRLVAECETGGYKESGIDRAGGIEGMLKYTELKHIMVHLD